jgi:hypothetical protein
MKTQLTERIRVLHKAYTDIQVIIYQIGAYSYTAIGRDAELCAKANKQLVRNTSGRVFLPQYALEETIKLLHRQRLSVATATKL